MEVLTLPLFLADYSALPSIDSGQHAHGLTRLLAPLLGTEPSRPLGTFCISSCCFNVVLGSQSCAGASASFTSTWPCVLARGVMEELSS